MKKRVLGITMAAVFAIGAMAGPALGEQGGNSADAKCGKTASPYVFEPYPDGYPAGYLEHAASSAGGQKAQGGLANQGAFFHCSLVPGGA